MDRFFRHLPAAARSILAQYKILSEVTINQGEIEDRIQIWQ